ncbi:hypothetical protein D3C79_949760 [compost metagenome]
MDTELPQGVTAQLRTDGTSDYVFLSNFNAAAASVALDGRAYSDLLTGEAIGESLNMDGHSVRILKRKSK